MYHFGNPLCVVYTRLNYILQEAVTVTHLPLTSGSANGGLGSRGAGSSHGQQQQRVKSHSSAPSIPRQGSTEETKPVTRGEPRMAKPRAVRVGRSYIIVGGNAAPM